MNRRDRQAQGGGQQGGAPAPSDPPLHFDHDRAMIRLEVLRLAHRHDVEPAAIIARATALTAWVLGEQPGDKPA